MVERVVVGVDGSAHADRALQHAVDEAAVHGASLTVVLAYVHPRRYALQSYPGPREWAWLDEEELRRATARELAAAVDRVRVPAGVEVTRSLVESHPVAALLEAAGDADLLVVGSRGRGGFRGMLLGSTSHEVVTHAPCPVLVVPAAVEDQRSRASS